jgi:hypothetical protein
MISPSLGSNLAEPIAEVYRDAELRVLERITAAIADGIDRDDWDVYTLARLQSVRQQVIAMLAETNPVAAAAIEASLLDAYGQGIASTVADIAGQLDPLEATDAEAVAAVAALLKDVSDGIDSVTPSILRQVDDVFREVVAEVTASSLTRGEPRRAAAQRALTRLAGRGLKGVPTSRGTITLDSYVSMAVRTAAARSALAGQLDTMGRMNLDLVMIQPGPQSCDICDGWARRILSRTGGTGLLRVEDVTTGEVVEVMVDATLDQARSAGWGHPNCRCNLGAYLPGATEPSEFDRPPWDEDAYKVTQRQRAIERQIREWKQRAATSITPEAKADAKAKVAGWQAAMRDFLDEHPEQFRNSKREQIGRAR